MSTVVMWGIGIACWALLIVIILIDPSGLAAKDKEHTK